MLEKLGQWILDYLKEKPFWARVRPFVVLAAVGVAALIAAYKYVEWRYGIALDVGLFLRSYITRQVLIVFGGLVVGLLLLQYAPQIPGLLRVPRIGTFVRTHGRAIVVRSAIVLVVAVVIFALLRATSPDRVTHIRIQFLETPPAVEKDALAYLVYELNRRQKSWYFEFEFDDFNAAALPSAEQRFYRDHPERTFALAERAAGGGPYIALTGESIHPTLFCASRGPVSVISTEDRSAYLPLSDYEFVVYSLIVQGIVIHLDQHGGVPPEFFERATTSRGSVFAFSPDPRALKSVILTAELRSEEEALLLNRFGPEYLQTCKSLLSLEWMRTGRVAGTLKNVFGVKLATAGPADEPKKDPKDH
jgi:hypothetical protein